MTFTSAFAPGVGVPGSFMLMQHAAPWVIILATCSSGTGRPDGA